MTWHVVGGYHSLKMSPLMVWEQRRFDDLEEKAEVFRQSITMCHISRVPCHMSRVRCPVSGVQVTFFGGSGGTSRWRVCYQQGLPRLVFNRLSVGRSVLQSPLVNNSLIHSFIEFFFCSAASRHCVSWIVRAKELTFWENTYPTPCGTCHLSHVTYQVSGVRCQVWSVTIFFFFFLSFGASWWKIFFQHQVLK